MRIIIYNSSSFGGCFDYGRELWKAYNRQDGVNCEWWVPENATVPVQASIRKIFLNDLPGFSGRIFKQFHFLIRVFLNPFLLFFRLAAAPESVVILNDFEQLSATFWTPFFRWFLSSRHRFVVILHDPDRDAYPPSLTWTRISMNALMAIADYAFYHDYLPEKSYYKKDGKCRYSAVPHGVFEMPEPDGGFLQKVQELNKGGRKIMSIPGNIRREKNYELAIEALTQLPDFVLLVAGAPANARLDLSGYKTLAASSAVTDRVIWIEHYLSASELSAVLAVTDVLVLNYADSFTSQSGILNVAANFRKPVVVSDGRSSLVSVVRNFGIGTIVNGSGPELLASAIRSAVSNCAQRQNAWDSYLEHASWEKHTSLAVNLFKEISVDK